MSIVVYDEEKDIKRYVENFILNKLGYSYTLKLIEKRINIDIEDSRRNLEVAKENYLKIEKNNFLDNIKREYSLNEYTKLKEEIEDKIEWKELWKNEIYIDELQEYRNIDIIEIRNNYWEESKNEKLFLILQEAILTPIYYKLKKGPFKKLKENNIKRSSEILSRYLNLKEGVGINILNKTRKGIKEGNRYLNRGINYTLMKNKIKTEKILGNSLVGKSIDKIKDETLLLFMIKVLNYIKYLKAEEEIEKIYEFKKGFLDFKILYERNAMFKKIKWNENKIEIINFAYIKLIQI